MITPAERAAAAVALDLADEDGVPRDLVIVVVVRGEDVATTARPWRRLPRAWRADARRALRRARRMPLGRVYFVVGARDAEIGVSARPMGAACTAPGGAA